MTLNSKNKLNSEIIFPDQVQVALWQPGFCGCGTGQPIGLHGAKWITCSKGDYPNSAIFCDWDFSEVILVSRATAGGEILPGKFHKEFEKTFLPQDGEIIPESSAYQVLTAEPETLAWIPSSNGKKVKNAVIGGITSDGEYLFIGRFLTASFHSDRKIFIPGKIQPSLKKCIIARGNKEESKDVFSSDRYEILIGVPNRIRPVPGKFAEIVPKINRVDQNHQSSPITLETGQITENFIIKGTRSAPLNFDL